jgi:putative spermidine/putrescine transport system permease protein
MTLTHQTTGAGGNAPPAPHTAPRRRQGWQMLALLAPVLVLILTIFDWPLLQTMYWSILDEDTGRLTLAHFREFWESQAYLRIIWRTLRIALTVTAVTILLGYPLAYWATRLSGGRRLVVLGLVVMTFWVSILVRTYAWIVVLGSSGLINRSLMGMGLTEKPVQFLYNEVGIIIGMVNVLLPFLVLPLYAAMVRVDQRLLQVAETMGAKPGRVFWQVFFPLTIGALVTSSILVFILALGFYITPAILGGGKVPLVANMMDLLINRVANWNMAAVVSVVLLAMTLSLYALYQRLRDGQT